MRILPAACALLSAMSAFAQEGPPRPRHGPPDGEERGPRAHLVLSASSRDGLTWTLDPGTRLESCSVPCAVVTPDDRIRLYFVDASGPPPEQVNVAESTDGLTFTKLDFTLAGQTCDKSLDPSIVLTPDGTYLLYYFASRPGRQREDAHEIHRASSPDGVHFVNEGKVFAYEGLVDPDVFRWQERWFMYVFGPSRTVVATSKDGLAFDFVEDLHLRGWGTTAPVNLGDSLRLYAFDQRTPCGNEVRSFRSQDGLKWEEEAGSRLVAPDTAQYTDPFVVRWKDGWKMYFKTERRRAQRKPGGGR